MSTCQNSEFRVGDVIFHKGEAVKIINQYEEPYVCASCGTNAIIFDLSNNWSYWACYLNRKSFSRF